ncbi:hypothetical protein C8Q78DRAFT_1073393 [Trametes maxima]|nr:hypothetical protein C8Q78DRAFT_1073393 [Trametes maxima]
MSYPTSSLRVQFAPNTLAPPTERRSLRSPPPKARPQPRPQHQHQQHQHQQPPRRQPHQGYGPGCKLISLREAQARPEIVYPSRSRRSALLDGHKQPTLDGQLIPLINFDSRFAALLRAVPRDLPVRRVWISGRWWFRSIWCWRREDVQSEDGAPPSARLLVVRIGCGHRKQGLSKTFLGTPAYSSISLDDSPGKNILNNMVCLSIC